MTFLQKVLGLVLCMFVALNCLQASDTARIQQPGALYYTLKTGAHVSGILFTIACGWVEKKSDEFDKGKLVALCAVVPHLAGIAAPCIHNLLQKKKAEQPKTCAAGQNSSWWLGIAAYFGAALVHYFGGVHCFRTGKKIYSHKVFKTVQNLIPGLLYHATGFALGEFAQRSMKNCKDDNQPQSCKCSVRDVCKQQRTR